MDTEKGEIIDDHSTRQIPSNALYFAAISALFGAMANGLILGWASPTTKSMKHFIGITDDDTDLSTIHWISSIPTAGAIVGVIISGSMSYCFGRRMILIFSSVPYITAIALSACSHSVAMLLIGRAISGFSCGMISLSAPIYIVEISTISNRGVLGVSYQLSITIGILTSYILGAFINWRIFTAICAIPIILMAIFLIFMPETPYWLVTKEKFQEARKTLELIRSPSSDIELELSLLRKKTNLEKFSCSLYLYRQHGCPLLLSIFLMFFQQFSGINAVLFYATSILIDAGTPISPEISAIIAGATHVFATFICTLLIDRIGRKKMLRTSGTLMMLSSGSFAVYYSTNRHTDVNPFDWVAVGTLISFIVGYSLGLGPIPWLMIGELTPFSSTRISTFTISVTVNWICAFLITQNYESFKNLVTKQGTFLFFAIVAFFSVVFAIVNLPETKHKSSEEIQQFFVNQILTSRKKSNPVSVSANELVDRY